MKAGSEIHFIAGQLFTLGVAALAVGPRMPFDYPPKTKRRAWCNRNNIKNLSIGGRLSFPFRRALLGLVMVGLLRVIICHIMYPNFVTLDAMLGTIHVTGQSFLCLTTAYILQVQLSSVINIQPGNNLIVILTIVASLGVAATVLERTINPNFYCLEHVAEAISCYGVLSTLATYSSVVAPQSNGRGPFLTQLLRWTEYWFCITSIIALIGEATHGKILKAFHNDELNQEHPFVVLLESFRYNQDKGVDDWTRLLIHSIFLNSIDELNHFTKASGDGSGGGGVETGYGTDGTSSSSSASMTSTVVHNDSISDNIDEQVPLVEEGKLIHRSRQVPMAA